MMKPVLFAFALAALNGAGATAQNASEIAQVKSGKSCPSCNLFQAELGYRDIKGLNLSGSRLRQSDMSLSTFDDSNFSGADLSVSNLFGTRFNRCDLSNTNLESATLVGAYLGSSSLSGANMSGANISGAELQLAKGLTQSQLNSACGDAATRLPAGLSVPRCR